jgi:hypothetical protein
MFKLGHNSKIYAPVNSSICQYYVLRYHHMLNRFNGPFFILTKVLGDSSYTTFKVSIKNTNFSTTYADDLQSASSQL